MSNFISDSVADKAMPFAAGSFYNRHSPLTFMPLTYAVDRATLEIESIKGKKAMQAATYASRLLDRPIQLVSIPIFTAWNYIESIAEKFKKKETKSAWIKIVTSPIVLPARILGSTFIYGSCLLGKAVQDFFAYKTVRDIKKIGLSVNRLNTIHEDHALFFGKKSIKLENAKYYKQNKSCKYFLNLHFRSWPSHFAFLKAGDISRSDKYSTLIIRNLNKQFKFM